MVILYATFSYHFFVMAEKDQSKSTSGAKPLELNLQAPKGSKSPMWLHFGFEIDKDGQRITEKAMRFRLCFREVGYSGNTTNLRQHMEKWHRDQLPGTSKTECEQPWPKQSTLDKYKPVTRMPKSSKQWKEITHSICDFIAKDMRPIATVEGEGFRQLMTVVQPAYDVPSRENVVSVLKSMYDEKKAEVASEVLLCG